MAATRHIICCDGTWNEVEMVADGVVTSTNVAKLAVAIAEKADDGWLQSLHYHRGVGTEAEGQVVGGALGWGLTNNIIAAYDYLVRKYKQGDEICIFGFSRGAFTARSLAALIQYAGIIKDHKTILIEEALSIYRDRQVKAGPNTPRAQVFRRMYSQEADIRFIGVWDTVGSMGLAHTDAFAGWLGYKWQFHDTTLGAHVKHAVQALAIHEMRAKFPPTLWSKAADAPEEQTLEQIWFSGVHGDVGGGYPDKIRPDPKKDELVPVPLLSDITFDWMMERARTLGGVAVKKQLIKDDMQQNRDWRAWASLPTHNEYKGKWTWLGQHQRGQDWKKKYPCKKARHACPWDKNECKWENESCVGKAAEYPVQKIHWSVYERYRTIYDRNLKPLAPDSPEYAAELKKPWKHENDLVPLPEAFKRAIAKSLRSSAAR